MANFSFWRGINFSLVSLLLRVSVVLSRFTSTFLNDNCLKPLDYSIYPRCIIRTMIRPQISCDETMPDEITIIEDSISSVSGIVFECYADEPLDLEFDGLKALPKALPVPVLRNLSKVEYGLYFGYKPIDRNIAGKYSFFRTGNRSFEKSFYVYFKGYPHQNSRKYKYKSPFIFQNPSPYQLPYTDNYVLPCRPYDKSTNVKLLKSGINVTETTWTSFQPQLGFVINIATNEIDPWGHYECISGSSKLTIDLAKNVKSEASVANTNEFRPWQLQWYIKGMTMNCNVKVDIPFGVSDPLSRARLINLVNIRTINPLDSKLKFECKEEELCQGVYSKQVGQSAGCVDETNETQSCAIITKYYDSGLLVCSSDDKEITLEYFTGLDNLFYPYYEMENKPEVVIRIELQVDVDNNKDSIKYIDRNVTFRCTSVYYGLSIPILWYTQDNDGEFQIYDSYTYSYIPLTEQLENIQVSEEFTMTKNMTAIMCAVRIWNSTTFLNATHVIPKLKSVETPPTFEEPLEKWTFYTGDNAKQLHCRVKGLPPPTLEWRKNNKKIDDPNNLPITTSDYISTLAFNVVKKADEGNYTCTAVNRKDKSIKTFILRIEDPPSYTLTIVMSTLSVLLVFGFVISLVIVYHKRKLKTVLTKSERDDFMKGNGYASFISYETAFAVNPYNEEFEVAKRDMIIYRDIVLGSGEFGIVYKGKVKDVDVAIKTTKKDNSEKMHVTALLAELKVMMHIGEHRHVVSLVGARTKEMWKGEVYVALQLLSSGNLKDHLRSCQKFIALKTDGTTDEVVSDFESLKRSMIVITTKNLWKWSYQIACGMAHLSEKNIIHGDLAARNILLCEDYNAKISDFGLSRKMCGIYAKTSKNPLPWRWMALEALEFMQFSTKSDVWSFGVTMWEIFSLGAVPFPGINYNVDFVEQLRKGLRLSKPEHACDNIYELMASCWHDDVEVRPSSAGLNDYLYKQLVEMPADPFSHVSYV